MRRKRRPFSQWVTSAVLPAFALVVSLLALWLWFTETREESITPSEITSENLDDQMTITLTRANDAVNSAELILSFLEGASVIITISIAAAAVVGLSSINELRDAVDDTEKELLKRVEKAEARLKEREKELDNIEDLLAAAEARLDRVIDERLERVTKQSMAVRQYSLAEQLLGEKNIDAALQACEEAHELDPDNYANNYLYGILLLDKGNYEDAIIHLREVMDIQPDFVPAIAALGLANRRMGDLMDDRNQRNGLYNNAEARLLDALERDNDLLTQDGESYYGTLGSLYRRQGRIQDALDSYRQAAEITPIAHTHLSILPCYFCTNMMSNSVTKTLSSPNAMPADV